MERIPFKIRMVICVVVSVVVLPLGISIINDRCDQMMNGEVNEFVSVVQTDVLAETAMK